MFTVLLKFVYKPLQKPNFSSLGENLFHQIFLQCNINKLGLAKFLSNFHVYGTSGRVCTLSGDRSQALRLKQLYCISLLMV